MEELTDLELQSAEMSLSSISIKLKERVTFLDGRDQSNLDEQETALLIFRFPAFPQN